MISTFSTIDLNDNFKIPVKQPHEHGTLSINIGNIYTIIEKCVKFASMECIVTAGTKKGKNRARGV